MSKIVKLTLLFFLVLSFLNINGCHRQNQDNPKQPVLLIGFDGFCYEYLEKTELPNLNFLIHTGVRAPLIPVFPSKTFPNFYTIVTGLYPEKHGIVANNMYDPQMDARFSLGNRQAVTDARWWGGEPIWVTAARHGLLTATYFWVGSEAPIQGLHPTYWFPYDDSTPNEKRIQQVFQWLDLPYEKRPAFIAVYFDLLDDAGHEWGPNSPELLKTLKRADELVGMLTDGLKKRHLLEKINLLIVSDHGMAEISPERVIFLDDYIDLNTVEIEGGSPLLGIWPKQNNVTAIYKKLVHAHPHLKIYRKNETPERFHYRNHRRIPPIVGLADEGWSIGTHESFRTHPQYYRGGNHGFDPQLPSMRGIFIARGPAFKSGLKLPPLENIHLYNLMCFLLNIPPAPNDGNFEKIKIMLENN
ncbi:MAG: alkaline phosphatase family protein [Calditrichaeota bacterium]|nr:MAG: alkaline phosphatase family protein [Calditrichota bacterium]